MTKPTIKEIVDKLSPIEESNSEDIQEILSDEYPDSQVKVWFTGGYDSPRYAINCYSVAWIEDGKLNTYQFTKEYK